MRIWKSAAGGFWSSVMVSVPTWFITGSTVGTVAVAAAVFVVMTAVLHVQGADRPTEWY